MPKIINPMTGIRVWRNEKNKFVVFESHYSANEAKRSADYRDQVKSAMPYNQYMQEYELVWDSYQGKPVYPDWSKTFHGSLDEIKPQIGLPLLVGVDFGLTPAACIAQLQEDTLVILDELTEENMGAERFTEKLKKHLGANYGMWNKFGDDIKVFIDPSGFFRKDTDEGCCAMVLKKAGFKPIPGPVAWEERRSSVETFLIKSKKGKACFKVNINNCTMLINGFDGGYRYLESAFDIEPNKVRPIKDMHSHIHDALQYVCSALVKSKKRSKVKVKEPGYSWSRT